jgi:predicted GNAT family acetyltransferase
MDIEVVDVPDQHRFEARTADGTVAGFSAYDLDGARVILTHTEVDDAFAGEGVGSELVRGVLDQLRDRGRSVRPDCPFVREWIDRHPAYGVLVTP